MQIFDDVCTVSQLQRKLIKQTFSLGRVTNNRDDLRGPLKSAGLLVSELLRCGLLYPHKCELCVSYKTCCRKNTSCRICGQLLRFPIVRNCLVSFLNRIWNNVVASLRSGGAVLDSGGGIFFLLQIVRTGPVARPA